MAPWGGGWVSGSEGLCPTAEAKARGDRGTPSLVTFPSQHQSLDLWRLRVSGNLTGGAGAGGASDRPFFSPPPNWFSAWSACVLLARGALGAAQCLWAPPRGGPLESLVPPPRPSGRPSPPAPSLPRSRRQSRPAVLRLLGGESALSAKAASERSPTC